VAQPLGTNVDDKPVVLSTRVTTTQSKVTVSGHVILYLRLKFDVPAGTTNDCCPGAP
jgi:hypothetical protein